MFGLIDWLGSPSGRVVLALMVAVAVTIAAVHRRRGIDTRATSRGGSVDVVTPAAVSVSVATSMPPAMARSPQAAAPAVKTPLVASSPGREPLGSSGSVDVARLASMVAATAARMPLAMARSPQAAGLAGKSSVIAGSYRPRPLCSPAEIAKFFSDNTRRVDGSRTSARLLYARFEDWCEKNAVRPQPPEAFGRYASTIGLRRKKSSGNVFYLGIELER